MAANTQYFRTITCEFFGKSAFAGTFKIEVDASGVPVSPLNYESLSGDEISSVAYYENDNELQVNGTNDGVAVMHNFSTATEDTTYNERDPEGTWSYKLEVIPPEPPVPPTPTIHYGFNLSGMLDTDFVKQGGIR